MREISDATIRNSFKRKHQSRNMAKKKTPIIVFFSTVLSLIVLLIVLFVVFRNEMFSYGMGPIPADYGEAYPGFLSAPTSEQFWIFLKNIFNPQTWEIIFG